MNAWVSRFILAWQVKGRSHFCRGSSKLEGYLADESYMKRGGGHLLYEKPVFGNRYTCIWISVHSNLFSVKLVWYNLWIMRRVTQVAGWQPDGNNLTLRQTRRVPIAVRVTFLALTNAFCTRCVSELALLIKGTWPAHPVIPWSLFVNVQCQPLWKESDNDIKIHPLIFQKKYQQWAWLCASRYLCHYNAVINVCQCIWHIWW
jgi:hypothetical protein